MNHEAVVSQIRSALRMLRHTIEACPEDLWDRKDDHNRSWALAYHAVYFAHLYLSPSSEAFTPYVRDVKGRPGFGHTDLDDWSKLDASDVYAPADVLAYCDYVDAIVPDLVACTLFDAPSGFSWLPFTRGEAHLDNLRHIQHHAGQLAERLRQHSGIGGRWVSQVR